MKHEHTAAAAAGLVPARAPSVDDYIAQVVKELDELAKLGVRGTRAAKMQATAPANREAMTGYMRGFCRVSECADLLIELGSL